MAKEDKLLWYDIPIEIKNTTEDSEFFYFEGYGSTKDLDLVDDIVEPGAFRKSLKVRTPSMLWQHNTEEPVGIWDKTTIDSKGLFMKGKMPLDDTFVSGRVVPQMKIGSIKGLSIGFRTVKAIYDTETNIRTITELDLREVSLVTFPANPAAQITALKSALTRQEEKGDINTDGEELTIRENLPEILNDRSYRWNAEDAEKRIAEWELHNKAFSNAYIYKCGKNNFLIGDVIKGEIQIVPRAVFAVRAELSKKDSTIPEDDRNALKEIVNILYDEMELEPPFNGEEARNFSLSEITGMSKSLLCRVIQNKDLNFTRKASNYLASCHFDVSGDNEGADESEKIIKGLREISEIFNTGEVN